MKRRKFLGLLGLTTAAAAAPAAALANTAKATEKTPGSPPEATKNPCQEIGPPTNNIGPARPPIRVHGYMPITPSMQCDIDACVRYQTKAMNGDPIDQERTAKALSKIANLQEHIKHLKQKQPSNELQVIENLIWPTNRQDWLDELIEHDQQYITSLQNAISKENNAKHWQDLADHKAQAIENDAQALGYNTEWPGLYPEFHPPRNLGQRKRLARSFRRRQPPANTGDPKDAVFAGFIIEMLTIEPCVVENPRPYGTGRYWRATEQARAKGGSPGFWVTNPQHATSYLTKKDAQKASPLIEPTQIIIFEPTTQAWLEK